MQTKVYATRLKNQEELNRSSSGGMFTALASYYLENGNYVLCSVYDYSTQELRFKILDSISQIESARGSKYFQSEIGTAFKDAIELLKKNPDKQLLFVGMGCQADGFRKLSEMSGVRDRVFVADIICTGNPSPKIWKDYISRFEKVSYLTFKDKRNGWYKPTAVVISNEQEISLNDWLKIFYGHNADKPACYKCPFARTVRMVDMTIGDFWRIDKYRPEFYSEFGNSVVLIHTEKGLTIFDMVKDQLDYIESNTKECWQGRLSTPPNKPVTRTAFWRDYKKHGIEYVIKKYNTMPLWGRIATKIKRGIKKVNKLCMNK